MKVAVHLADYAQLQADGKLTAVGLGWAAVGTPLQGYSVVALLELSAHEQAKYSDIRLRLLDGDGEQVTLGEVDVDLKVEFSADDSRPADPELPVIIPVCINVGAGMPLEPGKYVWRAEVGDLSDPDWARPFKVVKTVDD